jgi:putative copper resistance protein D
VNQIWNIQTFFAAARAVHFAACLALFSICVFDRFIIAKTFDEVWNRIAKSLIAIAMPAALLSGLVWFAAAAVQMSDRPLSMDVVRTVWTHTQFGMLCKLRLIAWIVLLIFFWIRMRWMTLIVSGVFLLSLAWTGHGQTGSSPRMHLFADILHLLAAGLWPMGLLPLALLMWRMKNSEMIAVVRRFSSMSVFAVALLLISSIANSCFLLEHLSDLWLSAYGRVLLTKISLFVLMLAIGAVNLLILKPRLSRTALRLRWNISIELLLMTAVLILVAILGLLPPPLQ